MRVAQASDPVPLREAVNRLVSESDRRDLELQLRRQAWSEGWLAGHEIGYDAGRRDAAAEESAQRREAAGMVADATRGPDHAELERRRWRLRGEQRTRQDFGQDHPDDYPGNGGAA
jgi:hypothetical protein